MLSDPEQPCPCGTGVAYGACCGPRHDGSSPAPTAEALMRSRYSAFVRGLGGYLVSTTSRPPRPGEAEELARWGRSVAWIDLRVHDAAGGLEDVEGTVSFTARYLEGSVLTALSETSRFVRVDGRWSYVEGAPSFSRRKLSRNDPCPCGSTKKLKACHGQG